MNRRRHIEVILVQNVVMIACAVLLAARMDSDLTAESIFFTVAILAFGNMATIAILALGNMVRKAWKILRDSSAPRRSSTRFPRADLTFFIAASIFFISSGVLMYVGWWRW